MKALSPAGFVEQADWMTDFIPRRWLRNGHVQTLAGNFLPRKLTLPEAGRELAKPCQCGVFNPVRAAAMVEEIMCLWGIHVV